MLRRWILGPLLGGLALFIWLGLSWAVLPFHMAQFHGFSDEAATQDFLRGQVSEPGLYMLPGFPADKSDKAACDRMNAMASQGPYIAYAAVLPGGCDCMSPMPYLKGMLYSLLAALIATMLLTRAGAAFPTFGCRWRACIAIGGIIALCGPLTNGAFFSDPPGHLVLETLDHIVGWTILGLVLAWSTRPATAVKEQPAV